MSKSINITPHNQSIILGNAPSSGSTLLVTLLGAHRDVFQTRELNIFDKPDWCAGRTLDLKERWKNYQRKKYDIHPLYEHAALFNGYEEIPDFSRYEGPYAAFAIDEMNKAAVDSGCSSFVEKTPNNIFSFPYLHKSLHDAKFVMVVRHPVSVYRSLRKRGLGSFLAVGRWYFANLVVHEMATRNKTLIVHYEKLTANPEIELHRIFQFLEMQMPPEPMISCRKSAETNELSGWTHDVRGPIKSEKVDNVIPTGMTPTFRHLRANDYFYDYVGIKNSKMAPMDLAKCLGYSPQWNSMINNGIDEVHFPWHKFAVYLASCLRHKRRVRDFWHCWE